jgi:hypothetical protein
MPTFIFINFQLSHEFFLICFVEKQNNVEAALLTKKILRCECFTVLKRFCSAGIFFSRRLLDPFFMGTGTPLSIGVLAFFLIFSYTFRYISVTAFYFYVTNVLYRHNYNCIFNLKSYHIAQSVMLQEASVC